MLINHKMKTNETKTKSIVLENSVQVMLANFLLLLLFVLITFV